jgi:hypothetical protein
MQHYVGLDVSVKETSVEPVHTRTEDGIESDHSCRLTMTSFRPVADFKGLQELPAVPGQFGAVAPLISGPIQTP